MTFRDLLYRLKEMPEQHLDKPAIFNDLDEGEWEIDDLDYEGYEMDNIEGSDQFGNVYTRNKRQLSEPGDPVLTP
jgi:hypothetical protein